ncbi:MAG TPA: hypothetical protein VEI57_16710, partial [Nitrospirota bacterium]|nr:hypothetical protein [Nitrospirota bacterium]
MLILALLRGGAIPVVEIANRLRSRPGRPYPPEKGHISQPELSVSAISETGCIVYNEEVVFPQWALQTIICAAKLHNTVRRSPAG